MRKGLRIFMFLINIAQIPAVHGAAAEGHRHFLKPIRIEGKTPAGISLAYDLACGEVFRGVVVKESRESVALGIVVSRSDKICSILPEMYFTKVALHTNKQIQSIVGGGDQQISLGEVQSLEVGDKGVTVSWRDCGRKILGVIFRQGMDQNVSVQLAQSNETRGVAQASCSDRTRALRLSTIQLSRASAIELTRKPGRLEQLYVMRVVGPERLSKSPAGELRAIWKGRCNERYMGMVFTGPNGGDVGLLTMVAANLRCVEAAGDTLREADLRGLKVTGLTALKPVTAESALSLSNAVASAAGLKPPLRLRLARSGESSSSVLEMEGGCEARRAAVFSNDPYGNLAAATIAARSDDACLTRSADGAKTQRVPLAADVSGPVPQVFELKVFGTSAN